MGDPLRDRRPPRNWAAAKQVIEISDEIGHFDQLAEVMEADLSALDAAKIPANWRQFPVTGTLNFGFVDAENDIAALDISLEARVIAVCQRCLRPFELPVATTLKLLLSGPADDIVGRDGYEVWEFPDEAVRPIDIVAEALVMALPLAAMHEDADDCVEIEAKNEATIESTLVDERMTRPFAALRAQMDDEQ
jgi:uncharacterized metal-binding protein YceD (DUF177 family)